MAKKQSFADKASKKKHLTICPVCEQPMSFVKYVKAERSENGWRFKTTNVGVCKCNHSEVYG
jgi:formate dehydrogenase maturation protein FdhE